MNSMRRSRMDKIKEVYFVGTKEGAKANSYEMVTPCPKQAEEAKEALGPEAVIKTKRV